jgi:prepilin-type processing-associated H-X9-DG protein
MQCASHLKQLALAMHNYHAAASSLPPGAIVENNLSWNVFILPFIEQQALYDEFDFSTGYFNGGPSKTGPDKLIHGLNRIGVFMCPSAMNDLCTHPSSTLSGGRKTYTSHYYGIMGPKGTCVDGKPYAMEDPNPSTHGGFAAEGVLRRNIVTRIRDIADGTSSTLLLGEIAARNDPDIGNAPVGGGDGACWVRGIAFGTTAAGATGMSASKNVADGINIVPVLFNDITFSSHHPGGAQFAMCDGSVTHISEDIDLLLYKSVASRAHGEIAELAD